jgi:hypothetical protein
MDATKPEADAALRSIVQRDTGESYQEFLTQLAEVSGIETPTREELARLDRKRKHKGSNDDWTHPPGPMPLMTAASGLNGHGHYESGCYNRLQGDNRNDRSRPVRAYDNAAFKGDSQAPKPSR